MQADHFLHVGDEGPRRGLAVGARALRDALAAHGSDGGGGTVLDALLVALNAALARASLTSRQSDAQDGLCILTRPL